MNYLSEAPMESAVVLDKNWQPLHWHLPEGRSVGGIPDTPSLWEILWVNREILLGVAHSHPGGGVPSPSQTDVTTFAAVEAGLGVRLKWPIVTTAAVVICEWVGPDRLQYGVRRVGMGSLWVAQLLEYSK